MKPRAFRQPQFSVIVRRGLSGLGLFAQEEIPRGRFIIEYVGPLVRDAEADRIGGRYLFDLGNGWNIDGAGRANLARYANHACKPNAESRQIGNRIQIWSRKRIAAGEEITYDYGKSYADAFVYVGGCRCAAH